jgi:prophage maintenance system killer protein
MIDIQDVIRIHEILIDNFGGSKGIRDRGLLESAISPAGNSNKTKTNKLHKPARQLASTGIEF